jgi:hypothetical protein
LLLVVQPLRNKKIKVMQNEILVITTEQLRVEILKTLQQFFKDKNFTESVTDGASSPYVSKKDAAKLLACSPGTIDNFARAGTLKRAYVGKSVKFLRAEVVQIAQRPAVPRIRSVHH